MHSHGHTHTQRQKRSQCGCEIDVVAGVLSLMTSEIFIPAADQVTTS